MGAIGDAMGDAGLAKIPGLGAFANDPSDRQKKEDLQTMSQQNWNRRLEESRARMSALQNQSSAFQGANNVMASMYGPGAGQPPAGLSNNPMGNTGYVGEGGIQGMFGRGVTGQNVDASAAAKKDKGK